MKHENTSSDASEKNDSSGKMRRRDLLGFLTGTFAVNHAATMVSEKLGEAENPAGSNIVKIVADKGDYDVVYSDHHIPNAQESAEDVDALMLEQQMLYSKQGVDMYFKWIASSDHPEAQQYREVLQLAREKRKPVFFIDTGLSDEGEKINDDEGMKGSVVQTLESAIGVSLVGLTAATIHHDVTSQQFGRRQFLESALNGVVSTYLLTPRAQTLAKNVKGSPPDETSVTRRTQRFLQNVNRVIHPELSLPLTLDYRNMVMAQNAERVSQILADALGKKPRNAVYLGADHTGIEEELKATETDRTTRIKDQPNTHHEGKIARVDFVNVGGEEQIKIQILQDPAFKDA